jgi:hypothetical protein
MPKTVPLCFFPRIFELWEGSSIPSARTRPSHCEDCTPSYQLRMKKAGRCEHPDVMFTIEDGGVVGVSR